MIPNAVDVEKFTLGREPDEALRRQLGLDDTIVLGFIGSFYAYEGLAMLLEALPKILAAEPRVRVLLVGGGPRRFQSEANRRKPVAQRQGSFHRPRSARATCTGTTTSSTY